MKQLQTRNPYEILGLPRDAAADEIKAAYKKLAKQHHPDVEGGDAELMAEINWAYEVLSDPDKKAHFDRFGYEESNGSITPLEAGILKIWGDLIVQANFKPSSDFISDIRRHIQGLIPPLAAEVAQTNKTLPKLRVMKERIRRKDGAPNTILHIHMDRTIAAAEDHIREQERMMELHQQQLKYLDDFEFNYDRPDDRQDAGLIFANMIGASGKNYGGYSSRNAGW